MGGCTIEHHRLQPLAEKIETVGIVLIAALLVPGILASTIADLQSAWPGFSPVARYLALFLTAGVFVGLALYRMWRLRSIRTVVQGRRPASPATIATGLAFGLGAFLSNIVLSNVSLVIVASVAGPEFAQTMIESEQARAAQLVLGAQFPAAVMVLLLVIVTPIAEELFFRGYVYSAMRHSWGVPLSLIASSAIFGGFHFYIIQFLPILAAGLLFGWLYERTGTLLTPIVAHATVNAIVVSLLFTQF